MKNSPLCNTPIWFQLSGHKSEDYLKTGRKDKYEFIFSTDSYDIMHPQWPVVSSSGGRIQFPTISSTYVLESICHKMNFIDNCIQCFRENGV